MWHWPYNWVIYFESVELYINVSVWQTSCAIRNCCFNWFQINSRKILREVVICCTWKHQVVQIWTQSMSLLMSLFSSPSITLSNNNSSFVSLTFGLGRQEHWFHISCLWIKARGLGQGWTRPVGRAPGRPSPRAADPRAGSTWSAWESCVRLLIFFSPSSPNLHRLIEFCFIMANRDIIQR